jgi:NhaP-type Na+/H+ or K+/H+ antiporter
VVLLLVFALTLLLAVLISSLAARTVLSTAVLFLGAGLLLAAGRALRGESPLAVRDQPLVATLAELALFSVLFTDGMRITLRDLRDAWHLPTRALALGLPLTMAGTAVLARLLAGVGWTEAFLVGAALSPTDPVFAAAIVGRAEVPARLRSLLNIESGINDGLALPVVVVLVAVVGATHVDGFEIAKEVVLGVVLGIAVPLAAIRLAAHRSVGITPLYQPLFAVAIGVLVLALAKLLQANEFLAAFAAGITVASTSTAARHAFEEFGELLAELLKLAALLVFGALLSPSLLQSISVGGYVFALLALVAVRPLALLVLLPGRRLNRREWFAAAWFGPKGFASVVYGLLVLDAGVPHALALFRLIALVTAASIVAHSSTDVIVARWFEDPRARTAGAARPPESPP